MGHTRRDAVIRSQPANYAGAHQITAALTATGELRLQLDAAVATGPIKSKIVAQPVDGLAVGKDDAGAVGPYQTPFPFTGTITSVEWTRQ